MKMAHEGGEGRHKACPYGSVSGVWWGRRMRGARAGTRPAPTGPFRGCGEVDA